MFFIKKIVVFSKTLTFDDFTKKLAKSYKDLRFLLPLFWVRRIKILLHHKTKAKFKLCAKVSQTYLFLA